MKIVAAVLVAFGLILCAASAEAGKRVALVLGNGAYAHVPALPNPRRDAEAIAAALRRLGFEVELGVDLDLAAMRRTLLAYARKLEGAEVALFFYAGHGMQVHGQNYLLPVDADIQSEVDLDFAAMPARLVLEQMERWPSVKIVILDACRDNPFATALSRSMGATRAARALSRGLAQIEAAGGTLLAYATDPGDVASDGAGANSPFTQALLNHVETPGVEIHTMLTRVRADVYAATGERQRPWTESSLIGEVYLAPAPEAPPVTSAMLAPPSPAEPPPSSTLDPRQIELAVWEAAQSQFVRNAPLDDRILLSRFFDQVRRLARLLDFYRDVRAEIGHEQNEAALRTCENIAMHVAEIAEDVRLDGVVIVTDHGDATQKRFLGL